MAARRGRAFHEGMTTEKAATAVEARTGMLIRKPVAEVFEAVVDPAITSRFWFSRGSDRLDAGREVRWDWDTYGASAQVRPKAIEGDRRILVEWSAYQTPTEIEWVFTPRPEGTFVEVTNRGFAGDHDRVVAQAIGSTEGFALVLAGMKAFLEHGIALNLVPDRFPPGLSQH